MHACMYVCMYYMTGFEKNLLAMHTTPKQIFHHQTIAAHVN